MWQCAVFYSRAWHCKQSTNVALPALQHGALFLRHSLKQQQRTNQSKSKANLNMVQYAFLFYLHHMGKHCFVSNLKILRLSALCFRVGLVQQTSLQRLCQKVGRVGRWFRNLFSLFVSKTAVTGSNTELNWTGQPGRDPANMSKSEPELGLVSTPWNKQHSQSFLELICHEKL